MCTLSPQYFPSHYVYSSLVRPRYPSHSLACYRLLVSPVGNRLREVSSFNIFTDRFSRAPVSRRPPAVSLRGNTSVLRIQNSKVYPLRK